MPIAEIRKYPTQKNLNLTQKRNKKRWPKCEDITKQVYALDNHTINVKTNEENYAFVHLV